MSNLFHFNDKLFKIGLLQLKLQITLLYPIRVRPNKISIISIPCREFLQQSDYYKNLREVNIHFYYDTENHRVNSNFFLKSRRFC